MYCDNLGLVIKVNKLLPFRLAPTQAALHSKFDVLATIHALLKDFPLPPEIQHVKGLQDDHKAYKDLPLLAQLNCDADVLATNGLTNFPTACTHAPFFLQPKSNLPSAAPPSPENAGPLSAASSMGLASSKAYEGALSLD
jgi:hypothetical protein